MCNKVSKCTSNVLEICTSKQKKTINCINPISNVQESFQNEKKAFEKVAVFHTNDKNRICVLQTFLYVHVYIKILKRLKKTSFAAIQSTWFQ